MRDTRFFKFVGAMLVALVAACGAFAQIKSQEVSEVDGVPVLIKHLPEWETARNRATLTNNVEDLRKALGDRPVLALVDFTGGTEAVTAPYPAGKLLIVEYSNPQQSLEADAQFGSAIAANPSDPPTLYRRVGNYNVFVFDAADTAAAEALIGEIKYEKVVQWLGEDPYKQHKAERFFAIRTADIFLSTVFVIVGGIAFAVLAGLGIGLVYFRMRDQARQSMAAFSDAGGMTRLNLDELTESERAARFLAD